ncbi:MAG: hypothetical protein IKL92_00085, partial [Oscillospiraceae bacterium]|nr:hypothetical protein [Oscillospiraceae bacterium]
MKKFLLIVLALAMLLSTFVACGPAETPPAEESKTPGGNDGTSPPSLQPEGTPAPETTAPEETKIGNLNPNIDLGGKEFVIISRDDPWMKDEVSVEKTNGEPINDSIFQRN